MEKKQNDINLRHVSIVKSVVLLIESKKTLTNTVTSNTESDCSVSSNFVSTGNLRPSMVVPTVLCRTAS